MLENTNNESFFGGGGGFEAFRSHVSFKGYQANGDEKQQGEGRGFITLEKWSDIVYGWPLTRIG